MNQFLKLAQDGEVLLEKEISIQSEEGQKWSKEARSLIISEFGKNSNQYQGFKRGSIEARVMILKSIAGKKEYKKDSSTQININMTQNQITNIKNELLTEIYYVIQNSTDLNDNEKQEAKQITSEVVEECEKTDTNWEKIRALLKKSLDYGIKYAFKIMKLVESYHNLRGK
jgi:hypothetical protein